MHAVIKNLSMPISFRMISNHIAVKICYQAICACRHTDHMYTQFVYPYTVRYTYYICICIYMYIRGYLVVLFICAFIIQHSIFFVVSPTAWSTLPLELCLAPNLLFIPETIFFHRGWVGSASEDVS